MSDLPSGSVAIQPAGSDDAGGMHAPGAWLAAVRREHGLTVEQVASQLNLAPRQVSALEADDYAALPGMVIVRGFLRAYAKLLKVDPAPLLALLTDPAPTLGATPARQMTPSTFSQGRMPAMHAGADRSSKAPVVALLAVIVVAAGASYALGWWPEALSRRIGQLRGTVLAGVGAPQGTAVDTSEGVRAADAGSATGSATGVMADGSAATGVADAGSGKPMVAEPGLTSTTTLTNPVAAGSAATAPAAPSAAAPAAPLSLTPAAPPSMAPVVAPAASPAAAASAPARPDARAGAPGAANALVLNVQQDSWIEIKRADKSAMVSRLVKAGSVETFEIDQPVTLIIGNLAGVEATLRGAPLALNSGAKGNVGKVRIE